MNPGVVFRKIGGRIVPIIKKNPTAAGVGVIFASTVAATNIRQKTAEVFKGKGKTSFGTIPNIVADVGISAALIGGAHRFGGPTARRSIESAIKLLKGSFK